ncbi:hypothetical protein [Caballeronia novacaledonica]|uniref:Uncharacterized protein n=1 Tax=Caballeronia novacaledonica TaxID=1544861 RepID=A0AA37IB48_9BURK|nr:hypothetical protein [Caballeronia novacaledonica]GJH25509.1 hypothetical protein CBA19CS42_13355 [Caballeronia novacaledonica]
MFSFPAHDYQQQLIVAALDDFTPNAALPNYFGGQYGSNPEVWKQAVLAFLDINLRCGLIEATHRPELSQGSDRHVLEVLLTQGDADNGLPVDIVWDALYFNGTEELNLMLEGVNMRTWDSVSLAPNSRLIAELTSLYESNATDKNEKQ